MIQRLTPQVFIPGLSALAMKRLESVTIKDEAGIENDMVTLVISDKGYDVEWISEGREIQVFIGYKETGLYDYGLYEVDNVNHNEPTSGPVFNIQARAMKTHTNQIKKPLSRHHDDLTLGQIVQKIASENGFKSVVDPSVSGVYYHHVAQYSESGLNLLTRLALQHDCFVKTEKNIIYFKPKDVSNGTITIDKGRSMLQYGNRPIGVSVNASNIDSRNKYKGVKCSFMNRDEGKTVYVTKGSEPYFEVKARQESKKLAKQKCNDKMKEIDRNAKISINLPGEPGLKASYDVILVNFRPEICAMSPWKSVSVTHTFNQSGFTSSTECEVNPKK